MQTLAHIGNRIGAIPIASGEWRITRPAVDGDPAPLLLGFVELIGDVYGLTLIGLPLCRFYFGSLSEAIDEAVGTEVSMPAA
jgi:hypothetical protein